MTVSSRPRHPALAAALSFVFPGLGQAYVGKRLLAAVLAIPVLLLIAVIAVAAIAYGTRLRNELLSSSFLWAVLVIDGGLLIWRLFAIGEAGLSAPRRRGNLAVVGALLIVTIAMHAWAGFIVAEIDSTLGQVFAGGPAPAAPHATPVPPLNEPTYRWNGTERINFLLLGIDSGPGRQEALTDTILVVSVDPVAHTAVMVSVPRDTGFLPLPDTRIYASGRYPQKINQLSTDAGANPALWCPDMVETAQCGLRTLERSIGLYLGITINYYATVNLEGFSQLIDALGGVQLCLPGRLVDDTYTGPTWYPKMGIALDAGCNHYDGAHALAYARIRKGYLEMPDGTRDYQNDFLRADRQQKLLLALREEFARTNLVFDLPGILGAVGRTVATDFPRDQIGDLSTPHPARQRTGHPASRAGLPAVRGRAGRPADELPAHPEASGGTRRDDGALRGTAGRVVPRLDRQGAAGRRFLPLGGEPVRRRRRVLLVSMYRLGVANSGPTVRISSLRDALAGLASLDVVAGNRGERSVALARYAASGRLRGLDGIYVESSSFLPSPADVAFLGLARALGIPVLTFVRDAYQLLPGYGDSVKHRIAAGLFRPAFAALLAASTRAAFPSRGLATLMGHGADGVLLPPGAPPPLDVQRSPGARTLLHVGAIRSPELGGELLLAAVERARADGHDIDLICVARRGEEPPGSHPAWLRVERASGSEIHALLPQVLATVIPRRRSAYNDLAVPIKLMDYLSYGRPLLVTDCSEQARIVRAADAGLVVPDEVDDMAGAIGRLATASREELDAFGAAAQRAATANSWHARAQQVLDVLFSDERL